MGVHERVDTDIKCVCTAIERLKGGYDVFALLDFCCNDLYAERAGRCLDQPREACRFIGTSIPLE